MRKTFINYLYLLKGNQTAKNIFVLFFFTSAVNIINFIYHILMGRLLGPSEYSVLALIISVLVISTAITSTIQTAAAKYSSIYYANGNMSKIRNLFIELTRGVSIVVFLIFFLVLLFLRRMQSFLNVDSVVPILLLGIVIIFSSQLSIGRGVLQGTKKFITLGVNQVLEHFLKLIFGLLLVYLGFKSTGAALGLIIGLLVTFILLTLSLKETIKKGKFNIINDSNNYPINIKHFYKNILLILLITVIFSIISYSDIILVKHLFAPIESGYYSAVNQIGKIILFFPLSVGLVILPRLSEKNAQQEKMLPTIIKGLFIVGTLSSIFLIFYYFFPELIIRIMFGKEYLPAAKIVFQYGLVMTFIALINLELYYFIAANKYIYLVVLIFFLVIQLTLIFIFHVTLGMVINILLVSTGLLFLISLGLILYFEKNKKSNKISV